MIHLKNLSLDIHIHWLTIVYLIISILGHFFVEYLIAMGLVCLHEICHLMMAYYFQFDIDSIEILPFGAYLQLNDFYFHDIFEEICVVLAGPSVHFFIYILIQFIPYDQLKQDILMYNSAIFFFNLIPIYPMDGHRLICLCLQRLIDLKSAFYFSLKISVFCLSVLSVFYFQIQTLVIIAYLFLQQFVLMKFIPQFLRQYMSQLTQKSVSSRIIVHHDFSYRRGFSNYYLYQHCLLHESQIIPLLLQEIKK